MRPQRLCCSEEFFDNLIKRTLEIARIDVGISKSSSFAGEQLFMLERSRGKNSEVAGADSQGGRERGFGKRERFKCEDLRRDRLIEIAVEPVRERVAQEGCAMHAVQVWRSIWVLLWEETQLTY